MLRLSAPFFALCVLCLFFSSALFAADYKAAEKKPAPSEAASTADALSSRYYSIKLPEGWKVVSPPEEKQGNVNSIFSTDNGDCAVTIIMGPALGADAKEIASMFAEEFKATSRPQLKNGEYVFSFPRNDSTATARVSTEGKIFRLTTFYGDGKKAEAFLSTAILPPKATDAATVETPDAKKETPGDKAGDPTEEKTADASKSDKGDKDAALESSGKTPSGAASVDSKKEKTAAEKEIDAKKEGTYSCQFYTVKLPDGWKAAVPPEEQQGNINALFANASGNVSITLIVGPSLGADASTIASMFAEQFKATGKIKNQDGRYSFSFVQNGLPARAIITVSRKEFMLATSRGDEKEVANFYQNALSSENYPDLMPK